MDEAWTSNAVDKQIDEATSIVRRIAGANLDFIIYFPDTITIPLNCYIFLFKYSNV